MRNLKKTSFFSLGRKWIFTLALFLLVFAAASAVKIHAAGNVTGWLWGGSDDGAGNNTGVGWISVNNTNYGVSIPSSNGAVSGYAWSENIGWISFNSGDLAGCVGASGARREGDFLKGWARIMSIPQAGANAGGWLGCISLSGSNYGVQISKMLGVGSGSHTYAWSDELGWIDFGQAKMKVCSSMICATREICAGSSFSSCDASFCGGGAGVTCAPGGTSWTCSNDCGDTKPCSVPPASILSITKGKCGTANGKSICDGHSLSSSELCDGNLEGASPDLSGYDATWTCGGTCGGTPTLCSAKGKESCGWIETNP